jgi:DNA invertase Pin-like site-specific DNA recombinase
MCGFFEGTPKAAGCEKVFCEQVSAVFPEREQLEAALDYLREGDVLVVARLDRLAPAFRIFARLDNVWTRKGWA